MVEVRWTTKAARDLESIAHFIARDSLTYARRFVTNAIRAAERIGQYPKTGRVVPERGNPALREVILGNYRIVYRLKAKHAEVLTIHHGARLLTISRLKRLE